MMMMDHSHWTHKQWTHRHWTMIEDDDDGLQSVDSQTLDLRQLTKIENDDVDGP